MGEIHVFHDSEARPQEWRVEEIDSDGDAGSTWRSSAARTPSSGRSDLLSGLRMRPDCEPQPRMSGRLKLELMIGLVPRPNYYDSLAVSG
jgi:hypothetical protein